MRIRGRRCSQRLPDDGAGNEDRTRDLKITNLALYQLSYPGLVCYEAFALEIMERETGIEPATNSLEGCDSTTELLPPVLLLNNLHRVPMDRTGQNWSRMDPVLHQICTESGRCRNRIAKMHQIGEPHEQQTTLHSHLPCALLSRP